MKPSPPITTITLDILGEHTKSKLECLEITNSYIEILNRIKRNNLDCNISIKPSHIGTDIDSAYFLNNLNLIHQESIKRKNFLRIDMENSSLTDITIKAFKKNYQTHKNIGIVIQSYLLRSENDINKLQEGMNIRLCKGIYNENKNKDNSEKEKK